MTKSAKPYILVAEDDPNYGKLYLEKLKAEGFEVKLIQKSPDVFKELLHRKPDLLLMDIIMPGLDGLSLLDKIRHTKKFKDLPIIVASNLSPNVNRPQVASYKLVDYLVKSDVSIDEMVAHVRNTLARAME